MVCFFVVSGCGDVSAILNINLLKNKLKYKYNKMYLKG